MKVVFLDLDGVLITNESAKWSLKQFVPSLVRNLKALLDATGAVLVISSDWRVQDPDETIQTFVKAGDSEIGQKIVGKTLDFGVREAEILEWVENDGTVEKFIALDDQDFRFPNNPPWLLTIDPKYGFDDRALEKAKALLL